MALDISLLQPGDVVVTPRTGFWFFWVKLQAILTGKPAVADHVVIFSHRDEAGTPWGIEARPGGVGWVDMSRYDRAPYVVSNHEQPKTNDQRALVVSTVTQLLGTPYDYGALVQIAMDTLGLSSLWSKEHPEDRVPTHVICSSLADFAYEFAGLPNPGGSRNTRFTRPADWHEFIETHGWEN